MSVHLDWFYLRQYIELRKVTVMVDIANLFLLCVRGGQHGKSRVQEQRMPGEKGEDPEGRTASRVLDRH